MLKQIHFQKEKKNYTNNPIYVPDFKKHKRTICQKRQRTPTTKKIKELWAY